MTDRQFDKLAERLVLAVEKLAGIAPPAAKPVTLPIDPKTLVGIAVRHYDDAPDDRGLTRGGTPPEEFWAREDRDAAAMRRPTRSERRRPVTR